MKLEKVPYQLTPLSRVIAYKLYVLHVNDDSRERLDIAEIAALFSVVVSHNLLKSALEILRSDGNVSRGENKSVGYRYKLTHDGLLLVEHAMRNIESDIAYFHRHGDKVLNDIAGPDSTWMDDEERANFNAWSPLKIDRADPEFKQVLEKVDAAIERIRGDNGFAEEDPERRKTGYSRRSRKESSGFATSCPRGSRLLHLSSILCGQ